MKYEILLPKEKVIHKDDGRRLVLFLINPEDEEYEQIYEMYKDFFNNEFLDIILKLDYNQKNEEQLKEKILKAITQTSDIGTANDLYYTFLKAYYVADIKTGAQLFNNIEDIDTIIQWKRKNGITRFHFPNIKGKKLIPLTIVCIVSGIIGGLLISTATLDRANDSMMNIQRKYKVNAIYDSKNCTIYFGDTKFETIEYYIDYQKKVKKTDEINWKLQANAISKNDTLFLKDNCTIYLRGVSGKMTSEIQVINVSYYDFITELLATQDTKIKEMLITNSPSPFGNTTFMVDGIPQQVSYYKSSELREYIKRGFKVTELKTLGSNLNPTNKNYPKLTKITIQN